MVSLIRILAGDRTELDREKLCRCAGLGRSVITSWTGGAVGVGVHYFAHLRCSTVVGIVCRTVDHVAIVVCGTAGCTVVSSSSSTLLLGGSSTSIGPVCCSMVAIFVLACERSISRYDSFSGFNSGRVPDNTHQVTATLQSALIV